MSQENVEIVRRLFDAWSRGDFSVGADLLDPDIRVVWLSVIDAGENETRGVEAAVATQRPDAAVLVARHRHVDGRIAAEPTQKRKSSTSADRPASLICARSMWKVTPWRSRRACARSAAVIRSTARARDSTLMRHEPPGTRLEV